MSYFDRDGNEWDSWGGENWIIGFDSSKKVPRTKEEEAELNILFAKWDEEDRNAPPPPPRRNILYDFITGVQAEIELRAIIAKATGVDYKDVKI